ncbi:hypothetical protein DFH06DRAFT_899402, partial [Mycena polygramma]
TRASRAKPGKHTGTRKNVTVKSLIPLDAPTQPRNYKTPSKTSARRVPVFAKKAVEKRRHSVAVSQSAAGDDDDDEEEEELPPPSPTASEEEWIMYKRRQNTIAARRSRARKLAHEKKLEAQVLQLETELAMWRERAMMAQDMLQKSGTNL